MKPDFTSHIMFCLSTGNQPVNLVPALQFGVRRIKLFSTEYTDGSRLTDRLKTVLEKRDMQEQVYWIRKLYNMPIGRTGCTILFGCVKYFSKPDAARMIVVRCQ